MPSNASLPPILREHEPLSPRRLTGSERPNPQQGRILCVTSNFPRWEGDSTTPFVLRLAQDLCAQGWEVDVLAPHAAGAARREILGEVAVHRFRYAWPERSQTICYGGGALINLRRNKWNYLKLPALVLSETAAVMRQLLSNRYDVLHAHWIVPQGFTCAVAKVFRNIPLIVTAHGSDVFSLKGRFVDPFRRLALRQATAVTVNSRATESAVKDLYPGVTNLLRIPSPPAEGEPDDTIVAAIRRRVCPSGGPLLLYVGRIVAEKGVGELIESMPQIIQRHPNARLILVGEGQERDDFQRLTQRCGVVDFVHFDGWVDPTQIPSYLHAADVFIGPSWTEGMGLTFVEAMSAGTPVVATTVGGLADIIRDGETAVAVPTKNPAAIAAAVSRLVSSPSDARQFALAAKDLVSRGYSRQSIASTFSKLFLDAVSATDKSQRYRTRLVPDRNLA